MIKNERITSIDFVKGICIFLVVWGHSIQNMGDSNSFWENPIHIFICSFHMPIFMMISGLFFYKSIHKPIKESIKKRFIQLIVPSFGWSIIIVIIGMGYSLYNGQSIHLIEQIKNIIHETFTRFWFLRSVFICFTLALLSIKILKKDYLAFIFSFFFILLLPDNGRIHFDKFMYPFFWMGYFINKYNYFITQHSKTIVWVTSIIFICLLFSWQKKDYIYITGMSFYDIKNKIIIFHALSERLPIVIYRYFIGFFGTLMTYSFLLKIYNSHFKQIETIGIYTLGIYTIHIIIEGNLLKFINLSHCNILIYNFLITPITSIILIILCIFIIRLLEKNKFCNFLLLGKL